jgi:FkbM family methyltransferase
MNDFLSALEKKLLQTQFNNLGIENYDELRFGRFPVENKLKTSTFIKIKNIIKKNIRYYKRQILIGQQEFIKKYTPPLQVIYELLNIEDKKLLVDLIAFRILGYQKVKLPRNNKEYQNAIEISKTLVKDNDIYNPRFFHFVLQKCDLQKIGYNIALYNTISGVAIDFIIEQYAFKVKGETIVAAEKADIVLDIGACWGDTALYFANKTGKQGKVYSFEFIPDNIKVFNMNISLNPNLKEQIDLIQQPVSNKSGNKIYYSDNGPGSKIEFEPFVGQTGFATTISIDDFVKQNNVNKVDFIKMDIEGAEPFALKGAIETIKKFKPKLAIAIYHSIDDLINIPIWINALNLGYKLYLGHYTIHLEETIIFAKVE